MARQVYKEQVALLLDILPEVSKEDCFALHGGTAINLFVRDMPRISVDVDLTYLPIEDRATSIQNINNALERIQQRIEKLPGLNVIHKPGEAKLIITRKGAVVKLEVNLIIRGVLSEVQSLILCRKAQEEFNAFCEIKVVPKGQLYGGKICAALDRQHPRDLFDVKYLMDVEGISEEIKRGLLFSLLSSKRPLHELLNPHLADQREAMENQFDGMTDEEFTYEQYEDTRNKLIKSIYASLTDEDKAFLFAFMSLEPDWSIYDFKDFPSIRWKLQNLESLREQQPAKFQEQLAALRQLLKDLPTV